MGAGIALHNGYSRAGMGPEYLRVQFYEHARVDDDNSDNVAEFDTAALGNKDPSGFDPSGYLQYDLFLTRFDLWNSDYNIYRPVNMNARIDPFGINTQDNPIETVADSFLSWIRDAFEGTAGTNWQQFYADNIGIFLRNATIYNYPGGMVQFYKDQGVIPQTSIDTGNHTATSYSLRLAPQELDATSVASSSTLPANFAIYGWMDAGGVLSDDISTYWLLIADERNRLVWVASNGITHNPNNLNQQNAIDPTPLDPSRSYNPDDLKVILGG